LKILFQTGLGFSARPNGPENLKSKRNFSTAWTCARILFSRKEDGCRHYCYKKVNKKNKNALKFQGKMNDLQDEMFIVKLSLLDHKLLSRTAADITERQ